MVIDSPNHRSVILKDRSKDVEYLVMLNGLLLQDWAGAKFNGDTGDYTIVQNSIDDIRLDFSFDLLENDVVTWIPV